MNNRQRTSFQKKHIEQENIIYEVNEEDKTAKIINIKKSSKVLLIPRSIKYKSQEYIITCISNGSFYNSCKIKSVQFSDDSELQIIEEGAFSYSSIESISLPLSVVDFKPECFKKMRELKKIHIDAKNPQYKTYDDQLILKKSSPEKEDFDVLAFSVLNIVSIKIPDTIEIIESHAFEGCNQLKKIEISRNSKLKIIEEDAFYGSSIESIYIPSSVVELKSGWCRNTRYLNEIKIDQNNRFYKMHDNKFIVGKTTPNNDTFNVLLFCIRNIKEATIPSDVEIIESYSFEYCELQAIEIPSNSKLRTIGDSAFSHCSICDISIPQSLIQIGKRAFYECKNLHVEIPENSKLKIIEEDAFYGSFIESIYIPSSVVELKSGWCRNTHFLNEIKIDPNNRFYKMHDNKFIVGKTTPNNDTFNVLLFCIRNIKEATIPSEIEIIESYSFEYCHLYTVEIPSNSQLHTIKPWSFCESFIKSINLPQSLVRIGEGAFFACIFLECVEFDKNSELKIIEKDAFLRSSIKSINIPPHVISIGEGAFYLCENLQEVNFEENSEPLSIEKDTFSYSSIERIYLPSQINKIGAYSFSNCKQLKKIEVAKNSNLKIIEEGAFYDSSINSIDIPSSVVDLKVGWCLNTRYLNVIKIDPYNQFYKMFDNKLILGKTTAENETFNILSFCNRNIKEAIIPFDVEIIESYSFEHCEIQTVEIPSNSKLHTINDRSFSLSSIERINIPASLIKIGNHAFNKCTKLKQVEIPQNSQLQIIDDFAFYNSAIESISIPPHIKTISEFSFSSCKYLEQVHIPENSELETIEKEAFSHSSIKSIFIPPNVVTISNKSFSSCDKLCKIEIPTNSKLKTIEYEAFYHCNFTTINIPPSLIHIGKHAFFSSNLDEIVIPDNSKLETIEKGAFRGTKIKCISIPSSVVNLKKGCFNEMNYLNEIKIAQNNPYYQFYDNKYILGKTTPENETFNVLFFSIQSIKEAKIPSDIEIIESYSFNNCKLQTVEIPDDSKLQKINKYAFYSQKISNIKLPSSLVQIGKQAFYYSALEYIEIPENSNLKIIEEDAFCDTLIKSIYIPSSVVELKSGWCRNMNYLNEIKIDPNNQFYKMHDNKFILGKTTPNNDTFNILLFCIRSIKEATIPSDVEIIESESFKNCKIQTIKIDSNSKLHTIKQWSFNESSIKSIKLPQNLVKIGKSAFKECFSLQKIEIPENSKLQIIEEEAFFCSSIKSICIPSSVKQIGDFTFKYCDHLKIIAFDEDSLILSISINTLISNKSIIMIPTKLVNHIH